MIILIDNDYQKFKLFVNLLSYFLRKELSIIIQVYCQKNIRKIWIGLLDKTFAYRILRFISYGRLHNSRNFTFPAIPFQNLLSVLPDFSQSEKSVCHYSARARQPLQNPVTNRCTPSTRIQLAILQDRFVVLVH